MQGDHFGGLLLVDGFEHPQKHPTAEFDLNHGLGNVLGLEEE